MNEKTEQERTDALILAYTYLESRYKEQIDAIRSVDSSVKTRLAVLGAALGVITYLVGNIWESPVLKDIVAAHAIMIVSLIPVYFTFILAFLYSMDALNRQEAFPGFQENDFRKAVKYTSLNRLNVAQILVAKLARAIHDNEEIIEKRNVLLTQFQTIHKWATWLLLLPFGIFVGINGIAFIANFLESLKNV